MKNINTEQLEAISADVWKEIAARMDGCTGVAILILATENAPQPIVMKNVSDANAARLLAKCSRAFALGATRKLG